MSGLFGSKPKTPAPPPPTPMVDEEAVTKAKKRASQRLAGSSGRASTILGGSLGTGEKRGG